MPKLINNQQSKVIVHGEDRYEIDADESAVVDAKTNWSEHPYVVCGALKLMTDEQIKAEEKAAAAAKAKAQAAAKEASN